MNNSARGTTSFNTNDHLQLRTSRNIHTLYQNHPSRFHVHNSWRTHSILNTNGEGLRVGFTSIITDDNVCLCQKRNLKDGLTRDPSTFKACTTTNSDLTQLLHRTGSLSVGTRRLPWLWIFSPERARVRGERSIDSTAHDATFSSTIPPLNFLPVQCCIKLFAATRRRWWRAFFPSDILLSINFCLNPPR